MQQAVGQGTGKPELKGVALTPKVTKLLFALHWARHAGRTSGPLPQTHTSFGVSKQDPERMQSGPGWRRDIWAAGAVQRLQLLKGLRV